MTVGCATDPRRILYVTNEDWAFLLGRLLMARAAKKAGFEVHVATRTNEHGPAIEAEGFILHSIPFSRGRLSAIAAIRTILALRRLEGDIRPDIVHQSGLQCCFYGTIAVIGRSISQVNAFTGLGYIFTSTARRKRILKAIIGWMLPPLLNRRTSVVLVENSDDRKVLADLGVDEKRLVVIPGSGVDTDLFQPLPEPEGPITFGFAGRLLADKGIRALVSAHQILRDQGHDFRLVIAGKPDPANPASVSYEEVEEWSRRPGVTWLGHIDDIASLWRRCHFAILPSHREGLPVSLLEAAACGRALIATDAPGCREIVIDDDTGLQVPVENPAALANAILRLANSAQLRTRYARSARNQVVSKHSAKIVGASIVELYNELTLPAHG
ncbi:MULTISPECIES: glycosyltransferase family 4 protein [unclassified Bradyrhizobium]|uniref:glycosyltransferase family 4 protein n=1 Tax=unclassified Bradyrhizobium TaxID=2631580 RepID=UPI002FF1D25E